MTVPPFGFPFAPVSPVAQVLPDAGFVANIPKSASRTYLRAKLSCYSHKLLISRNILLGKLPLSDHVRRFNSIDSCLCRMKNFKPHHRLGDFFDELVILFNQVDQILDLANFYKINQPC